MECVMHVILAHNVCMHVILEPYATYGKYIIESLKPWQS